MNVEQIYQKFKEIKSEVENERLIAFVGAGVSMNVPDFISWYELVDKIAKKIKYKRCDSCKYVAEKCHETCRFKNEYSVEEFMKIGNVK